MLKEEGIEKGSRDYMVLCFIITLFLVKLEKNSMCGKLLEK